MGSEQGLGAQDRELAELAERFCAEARRGVASVEEYAARHPNLADRIRAFFPAMQALEEAAGRHAGARDQGAPIGPGIDPRVTLEGERGREGDFVSGALERLHMREGSFGRYELRGEVGRGGQGAVLAVWDEDLRRPLAMKLALSEEPAREEARAGSRSLARFLEEAQVTAQLDHPGIVPVHELGLDPERRVYFTMKLVRGRDLRAIFDLARAGAEGWTQARVLGVLLKVCEAMSYAHSKGVIHRDLKPSNVMVGKYGEVYVMDWGLARVVGEEDRKDVRIQPGSMEIRSARRESADELDSPLVTMDGDVVGTPAYMSPEQASGELESMGPHSDVYSVGAMLYELLSGEMPYVPRGARLGNHAVWALVKQGPPAPVHERARDVPAELVAICEKAMARAPRTRYRDMSELAEDLRAYLEQRVVGAYETGAIAELRKWVRRNKGLAGSMALAVTALLAGLLGALVLKGQSDRRREDVFRLSQLQDVEDLLVEAEALWPPHPEKIPLLESWLERAQVLLDQVRAHRATLAELRTGALPRTEEERNAEFAGHPRFRELETLEGEIVFRERALERRRGGEDVELPDVSPAEHSDPARALNGMAWHHVDPARTKFGTEPHGLALALRAMTVASGKWIPVTLDTLAWAYLSLGRDAEALESSAAALEAAGEERPRFELQLEKLKAAVSEASSPDGIRNAAEALASLKARRTELHSSLSERRDWRFPSEAAEARWWNNQLTKLIDQLAALETKLVAANAITRKHGWSVGKRLEFARALEVAYSEGGAYAAAWQAVLPALRGTYDFSIEPQMGLVPLGVDPESGLQEFVHLMTGSVPERDATGRLVLREDTGLVLVLLRGGAFHMGCQKDDPVGQNYDPHAEGQEGPVRRVTLTPFFLSKYEMTQAQWVRVAAINPSYFQVPNKWVSSLLHPVESITWYDCVEVFGWLGLMLPSEAQWEYGTRGGTSTIWWTGDERDELEGAANLADQAAQSMGAPWADISDWPELDDGHMVHAAVGTYRANPFGLHDVHGNVHEWCRDAYDAYFYTWGPAENPVLEDTGSVERMLRGGSAAYKAANARSAKRGRDAASMKVGLLGVRPARAVEGEIRYVR